MYEGIYIQNLNKDFKRLKSGDISTNIALTYKYSRPTKSNTPIYFAECAYMSHYSLYA